MEVCILESLRQTANAARSHPNLTRLVGDLAGRFSWGKQRKSNLYIGSTAFAPPVQSDTCIGWNETLAYKTIPDKMIDFDLVMSNATCREDFVDSTGKDAVDISALSSRVYSVPFLVSEAVFQQMHNDGLTESYLSDDLDAIRKAYKKPDTTSSKLLFVGSAAPAIRQDILERYSRHPGTDITIVDNGINKRVDARCYLRRLAASKGSLDFPGDLWRCYRFAESVMLGVPVITSDKTGLTPAVTNANAVVVDDWKTADIDQLTDMAGRVATAAADESYKQGWGLRAQVTTAVNMVL